MRILMLLRHAKAVPPDGRTRDYERTLAPRGQKNAPDIGAYMKKHKLLPDAALVSPAKRTRETWALLVPTLNRVRPFYEERLYNAEPQTVIDVIHETDPDCRALLIVGHNPSMHRLATGLVASGDLEAREQLSGKLPTCGLVTIEFPIDDWTGLHPRAGRLTHFVTPKRIAAATD